MTKRRSKRKNYSKRKPITHRKKKPRLVRRRTRRRKSYRSRRYKGSRGRGGGRGRSGRRKSSNPPQGKITKTSRPAASRPAASRPAASKSQTFRRPQPVISAGTGGKKQPLSSAAARAEVGTEQGSPAPWSPSHNGRSASASAPLAPPSSPAGDPDR